MSKLIEKIENMVLPAIPMRGLVIFPNVPTSFEINSKFSVQAMKASALYGGNIFLAAVRNPEKKDESSKMYTVGVVAKVKQSLKLPDGNYRLLVEARTRAEITEVLSDNEYIKVSVLAKNVFLSDNSSVKVQALMSETVSAFQDYIKLMPKISTEIIVSVQAITDPGMLADFIASNVIFRYQDKQAILEEYDPLRRLEKLIIILKQEKYLNIMTLNLKNGCLKYIEY